MDWKLELVARARLGRRPRQGVLRRPGRLQRRPRPPGERRAALRAAHPARIRRARSPSARGSRPYRARLGRRGCSSWSATSRPRTPSSPSAASRSSDVAGLPVGPLRVLHATPTATAGPSSRSRPRPELEYDDLRRGEEADRQAARPETRADVQVAAVLDDVPARVPLAVARRDRRAAQDRDRHLPAVEVAGERQRDAVGDEREHVGVVREQDHGRAGGDVRERGREVRAAHAQVGEAGDVEVAGLARRGSRAPRCRRRAARSTCGRRPASSRGCRARRTRRAARAGSRARARSLGGEPAAPQRVGVDEVAEQEDHVGRLVVEPLDGAGDRRAPACGAPAWRSERRPRRSAVERLRPARAGRASRARSRAAAARSSRAYTRGRGAGAGRRAPASQRGEDVVAPRHPGAGAGRARRERRGGEREGDRIAQRVAGGQLGGERAVDRVAGAGGVDDLDGRRGSVRSPSSSAPSPPSVTSTGAPVLAPSARAAASTSSSPASAARLVGVRRQDHAVELVDQRRARARG